MAPESSSRMHVLVLSTVAFTLLFAVWLMFGVLGVPIQKELRLTDVLAGPTFCVAAVDAGLARKLVLPPYVTVMV